MAHLSGLIAATHTAMQADGSLDLDAVERQARALVASGASSAFICGTTGESLSLTMEERLQLAEHWLAVDSDTLPIIIHVGDTSLPRCQALAQHAQEIRAHAIACMAPSFFRPACMEELVAFCTEVASAARSLSFYYYHIPIDGGGPYNAGTSGCATNRHQGRVYLGTACGRRRTSCGPAAKGPGFEGIGVGHISVRLGENCDTYPR